MQAKSTNMLLLLSYSQHSHNAYVCVISIYCPMHHIEGISNKRRVLCYGP